jgi:hypothetical protein
MLVLLTWKQENEMWYFFLMRSRKTVLNTRKTHVAEIGNPVLQKQDI